MKVQASGVLAAPANSATKPIAANTPVGTPNMGASALPSAAPMKNSGVTSPPLKPALSVTTVNSSFSAQLHGCVFGAEEAGDGEAVRRRRQRAETEIVARAEQLDQRDDGHATDDGS